MMRHRGEKMNKEKNSKKAVEEEVEIEEEVEVIDKKEELSETEILKAQVKDVENELNGWKTKYYKVFADMENTKRRLQTEHEKTLKFMMQDFASDLLPIIDNLERAVKVVDPSEEMSHFIKGFEMINSQLLDILSSHGVKEIKALHEEFNPNFHQAVMTCNETDVAENIIVEELQKGYTLNERVIRASLVKVNQK